ncbi:imidazolonepropionase [Anaeramoeba flamelloides]|uniref:Probable imidazolonepropionase n=1 Tax=Anaeramoeba flamelloides TaxID=1746091 RepID=A0ABQ8Z8H4_9EUKA|nr:imidazolonepropionase [Anaeramoeba flamelloides]
MTEFTFKTIIRNATQIVTVCENNEKFLTGNKMDAITIQKNSSLIINKKGLIEFIGKDSEINEKYPKATFGNEIDAKGRSIIPGFIDSHTHPVWSGDRTFEFALKLKGATYMQIHKQGGGIGFSVKNTQQSTEEELVDLLIPRLDRMVKTGTTLVEAKSGYGLETETEIRMLKVIEQAKKKHPIGILSTYLVHSVPKNKTSDEYTKEVLEEQMVEVIKSKKNGEISPEYIDIFCETGVFDYEQSKKIMELGASNGLIPNFHGDELTNMKSPNLAREVGAIAISHLEKVNEEGIQILAETKTAAVVLPTTAYILRLEQAPVRKMIQENVPVAIATDYNPNAPCTSMPLTMHMACVSCRMTMNEALVASTINAAYSLRKHEKYGSLEVGKFADLVIVDSEVWEHIIYQLGEHPIWKVIKAGNVIFEK